MPQELLILSPEKAVLSVNLARLASRAYAQILDLLILVVFLMLITFLMGLLVFISPEIVSGLLILTWSLGYFAYFIFFEGLWNGQTLGKRAVGVRVRMVDGTPVTFGAALGRNLLRVADFLPSFYFLGFMAMFTNPKSQRIGDMVAGTIVTQEARSPRFAPAPYILGVHPFEANVGNLNAMSGDEYAALKRMCDRFPELASNIQEGLIQELWVPFAERFRIAPLPDVHPIYLAEAVVMKYGRRHGLL